LTLGRKEAAADGVLVEGPEMSVAVRARCARLILRTGGQWGWAALSVGAAWEALGCMGGSSGC
jgi:hypothetical protein